MKKLNKILYHLVFNNNEHIRLVVIMKQLHNGYPMTYKSSSIRDLIFLNRKLLGNRNCHV